MKKLYFGNLLSKKIPSAKHSNWRRSPLLFLSLFFSLAGFTQVTTPEDKIDPVFRYIITHKTEMSDSVVYRNIPSPYKIKPTDGFAKPGGPLEKRYDCIVYTKNAQALIDNDIVVRTILPNFVTAWVTIEQLVQLSLMPDVNFIKAPDIIGLHNDVVVANTGASLLHQGRLNNTVYKGKNVIVAIFDTGIDWDHPDFRNPTDQTKSRILRIWDQTLSPLVGAETPPTGFGYGAEYTQAQINDELDGTPTGFVRETDINGHGTHVAGTAAGNGMALASKKYTGIAPEADLVIIKGGNGSFSSTNIIDALSYLQTLATSLGKPIVLNMSLGGQSGPHDGTQGQEIAVDNFTSSAAGRAVVISAGNDNGTNIHNQLSVGSSGTGVTSITVPSATSGTDVFQYTAYANNANTVTATVTTPMGTVVSALGATSVAVTGGTCTVNLSNGIDAGSGDRVVNVYITRTTGAPNPSGTWTISITNTGAGTITIDGWLNYVNASYSTTVLVGGNNAYLVGSPGNASSAITVASFVGKLSWQSSAGSSLSYTGGAQQDNISTFSSNGPRRDNVQKPDITAQGQAMISCLSSNMSPAPVANNLVVAGLYHVEQGTSMSSPAVAGCVALLLQAKPTATAAELKTFITSTANTDALTGAVPNTIWGYGRIDVFKAASTIFNCSSPNRKTYQYDVSNTSVNNSGTALTTHRAATRFTTDITGKLGGVLFRPSTTCTDMVMEIRTNNAGNPGTLLGTVNISLTNIHIYAWNYVDLSSLNLTLANTTDYFVVMYRDASSAAGWSLSLDNTTVDNRSFISFDGGGSWVLQAFDFRIRPIVYNNSQVLTGAIVSSNSNDTRDINTSNQFLSSCNLIAQLVPNGVTPVAGTVATNVWLEGAVPHVGTKPFVSRHYQIVPSTNPSTSSGRITLYFTQAEFTAFNADAGSVLDLPIDAADAANNKANLRIGKFPGTSNNGTGLPATYIGGLRTVIDPVDSDITWNAEYSRWEVSFNTTGFSGFIVQTQTTVLAINVEYFTGRKQGSNNILSWKVSCTTPSIEFEVERSSNGSSTDFSSIGTVSAGLQDCAQPFGFTDVSPLPGKNYYRIKITENTGRVYYTGIVMLQTDVLFANRVYPTIISKGGSVQVNYATGPKGSFIITDQAGRQVYIHELVNAVQSLALPLQASGTYFYSIKDEKGNTISSGKLIVQ